MQKKSTTDTLLLEYGNMCSIATFRLPDHPDCSLREYTHFVDRRTDRQHTISAN